MITYSVLDIKDNKIIGSGLTNAQVREMLGISNSAMVNDYANVGIRYKYRYEIQKEEGRTRNRKVTLELIKEWDDMCRAAELLRTGKGHIVTKRVNGKLIKCVEVIK
jgi:hypothetical protein